MKRKKGYRRGYPVGILLGFEDDHAVLWRVFSRVVKRYLTVELGGRRSDKKVLYNFHESVIDALRPVLKEGVRSIVVTAPNRTTYASDFLDHVRKHHRHLIQSKGPNRAIFAELVGSADQHHMATELVKTKEFRELIAETTLGEVDQIINILESHLYSVDNNSVVLYPLNEIEAMIYDRERRNDSRTEYLMLTTKYLSGSEDKTRIYRLLQISKNRRVKTRIVDAETSAGKRISQFGGMFFLSILSKRHTNNKT